MRISVPSQKYLPRENSLRCSLRERFILWICSFFLVSFLSPAVFGQGVTLHFAGDTDVGELGRWSRAAAEVVRLLEARTAVDLSTSVGRRGDEKALDILTAREAKVAPFYSVGGGPNPT
jgi:hypothetical protein